jgi:hypothetical protein
MVRVRWTLLSLEALRLELQGAAVLGDGPDDVGWSAIQQVGRNLQRHADLCVRERSEVAAFIYLTFVCDDGIKRHVFPGHRLLRVPREPLELRPDRYSRKREKDVDEDGRNAEDRLAQPKLRRDVGLEPSK